MVQKARTAKDVSLSSALFSGVQKRLLALLFGRPERSIYLSEIIRTIGAGTGAVNRELSRLEQSGLITMERIGNQKHYRANIHAPIFQELRSIVQKTMGMKEPVREALQPYAKNIQAAFVYGSVAKQTDKADSDIDLMIIGDDLTYSDFYAGLEQAEKVLGRPVNPTILSKEEWHNRRNTKNAFVSRILNQPKIFIFGSEVDLEA
jgi:predicted nucleotidyltransferase